MNSILISSTNCQPCSREKWCPCWCFCVSYSWSSKCVKIILLYTPPPPPPILLVFSMYPWIVWSVIYFFHGCIKTLNCTCEHTKKFPKNKKHFIAFYEIIIKNFPLKAIIIIPLCEISRKTFQFYVRYLYLICLLFVQFVWRAREREILWKNQEGEFSTLPRPTLRRAFPVVCDKSKGKKLMTLRLILSWNLCDKCPAINNKAGEAVINGERWKLLIENFIVKRVLG